MLKFAKQIYLQRQDDQPRRMVNRHRNVLALAMQALTEPLATSLTPEVSDTGTKSESKDICDNVVSESTKVTSSQEQELLDSLLFQMSTRVLDDIDPDTEHNRIAKTKLENSALRVECGSLDRTAEAANHPSEESRNSSKNLISNSNKEDDAAYVDAESKLDVRQSLSENENLLRILSAENFDFAQEKSNGTPQINFNEILEKIRETLVTVDTDADKIELLTHKCAELMQDLLETQERHASFVSNYLIADILDDSEDSKGPASSVDTSSKASLDESCSPAPCSENQISNKDQNV